MNFDLSQAHMADAAYYRAFAEKELRPYVRSMDIEEKTPQHIIDKMREYKLLGIPLAKEYCGAGKDYFSATLCMEELSKVSPSIAGIINVTTELVTGAILKYGTSEQKEKYVPPLASGAVIGAFAITEAGAGSDTASAKTKAVLENDHYVINGTKLFITNAELADTFLIGAKTDIGNGKEKLSMFIVEKCYPGFKVGKAEHKMGTRASSTCELILDDCIVPKKNLLGEIGKGMAIALSGLDGGRVMIGAQAVGISQASIDAVIDYLKGNTASTDALIDTQGVQFKLAELQTKTDAARLMVYRPAVLWDEGKPFGREAAMAKLYATEVANEVARDCIQIMGFDGCTTDYPVESMMRDAKITEIYEGTNEIQRLVIAGIMGLKA